MEKKVLLQKIKAGILSKEPDAEIFLFGSRARGDERKDSDWDILVLSPLDKISYLYESELRDPIFDIELSSGENISLLIYSKKDWQKKEHASFFVNQVLKEGIKI